MATADLSSTEMVNGQYKMAQNSLTPMRMLFSSLSHPAFVHFSYILKHYKS
jgi:hypothetical protein